MKKILLITDMHIAKKQLNGIDTISAFEKVLKHSKQNIQSDAIILCGDLAQDGTENDYLIMCKLLSQYYPDTPVYVIAGNHDHQENLANVLIQQEYISYLDSEVIETKTHQLIFLNSNIKDKTEGHICSKTLSWLHSLLNKTEKPTYIFTHHHCIPIGLKIDDYITNNRSDFLKTISPYNHKIGAVICGHTHNYTHIERDGIKFITLPSSSMQYGSTTKFEPENKKMYAILDIFSVGVNIYEAY